jgi:hypothetical protein
MSYDMGIATHPGWSDRAIAAEIGVDKNVVSRARKKSGGASAPPVNRKGKDGKSYPATRARKPPQKNLAEGLSMAQLLNLPEMVEGFRQETLDCCRPLYRARRAFRPKYGNLQRRLGRNRRLAPRKPAPACLTPLTPPPTPRLSVQVTENSYKIGT